MNVRHKVNHKFWLHYRGILQNIFLFCYRSLSHNFYNKHNMESSFI